MGRGTSRPRPGRCTIEVAASGRRELRPVALHMIRSSVIPHRILVGNRSHARFRGHVILLLVFKGGFPETARLGRGRSRVRAMPNRGASAGIAVTRAKAIQLLFVRRGTTSEIRIPAPQCLRAACDNNRYTPTLIREVCYKMFLMSLGAK